MGIGERIKNARKKVNLTQAELAEKIGVHEVTVRTWENTDKGPSSTTISKLAEALNTSVAYLVGETETHSINAIANERSIIGGSGNSLIIRNEHKQVLSDDADELLRLYVALDVRRRVELLNKAFALEGEMQKSKEGGANAGQKI